MEGKGKVEWKGARVGRVGWQGVSSNSISAALGRPFTTQNLGLISYLIRSEGKKSIFLRYPIKVLHRFENELF